MNPWLITWETQRKETPNPIAAILHNTTSVATVGKTMELLYTNFVSKGKKCVFPSAWVQFATRRTGFGTRLGQFKRIISNTNPMLYARVVFNLKLLKDEEGWEVIEWEEGVYPKLTKENHSPEYVAKFFNRKKRRPKRRHPMMFHAKTLEMHRGPEIVDEV
jgi:hypothetical protein